MTTYPLSELATIYFVEGDGEPQSDVVGRGTLEDCAGIVADLAPDERKAIFVQMDGLDLKFGPKEVGELLRFLRDESSGLSNAEIAEIKASDA